MKNVINDLYASLTRPALSLVVFLSLIACDTVDKEQLVKEQQNSAREIESTTMSAVNLQLVPFSFSTKVEGQPVQPGQLVKSGQLNAIGGFTYPASNVVIAGNLTIAIEATDAQGIKAIYLGRKETQADFVDGSSGLIDDEILSGTNGDLNGQIIDGTASIDELNEFDDHAFVICEQDCGAEFKATISGINPQLYGWPEGQNILELWTVDSEDNQQVVSTLTIDWQPKVITNVIAAINPDSQQLDISWTTADEFLWYNVYVANEPGITGFNIDNLPGGEAALGIKEKTVSLANKSVDDIYYLIVTGVDGTGEAALSSEITLVGGVDFTPPNANYDNFSGDEDTVISGNLLANDGTTGTNTIQINVTPVTSASYGQLVIEQNGTFQYQPNLNFHGHDQFSYQLISSNGLTAIALVDINVLPINDAPIANPDSFIIDSSILTVTAPGPLVNDMDEDGDTISIATPLAAEPMFGEIVINSDGSFDYMPGIGFTTFDRFSYQVFDGNALGEAVVVEILSPEFNGYPPFAIADQYQIDEDSLLVVEIESGILANDSDLDHAKTDLVFSLLTNTMHGELIVNDDGSFRYQPTSNFSGTDTFSYQLTDPDNNQTISLVTIEVLPQNDPPIANDDQYVVANVGPVLIPKGLGLLVNDGDIDGDDIQLDMDSVTLSSSGDIAVNSDGSFTYTATESFVGTDSFSYRVFDGNMFSNLVTVELHVVNSHAGTDDETPVIVDVQQVLGDLPSGASISNVNVTSGTITWIDEVLTYVPDIGFGGSAIITLEILIDNEVNNYQLVVAVSTNNRAPVITSANSTNALENTESGTTIFTVEATDPDQDALTFELTDLSGAFFIDVFTGAIKVADSEVLNFEVQPILDFVVHVYDEFGVGASQEFSVTLTNVEEAPYLTSAAEFEVIENSTSGTLVYQSFAIDPEGETVSFSLVDDNSQFDIDQSTGEITVSETAQLDFENQSAAQLTLQLSDGVISADYQLTVKILNVNEPPVITSPSVFNLDENTPNQTKTSYVATVGTDPEGNSITWQIIQDEHNIFAIESSTGELIVEDNTALDFETLKSYTITIGATETNGLPSNLSSQLVITISINDILDDLDSDNDGLTDAEESALGTNPNDPDSDDDNLLDGEEVEIGTNPLDEDSDDDLILDGDEVAADTDPLSDDTTPPNVVFVTPTDNATSICTNQGITLGFDEPIRAFDLDQNSVVLQMVGGDEVSGVLTGLEQGQEIFFRPDTNLATETEFTISVSAIKDLAGNPMAAAFTSSFTTGTCVESDSPSVLSSSPWDDADNVPRNAVIRVMFDEAIDPTTINFDNILIQSLSTDEYVEGEFNVSSDKQSIQFTPSSLLGAGHRFYIYLNSGVTDVYGNSLINFQFDFTTRFSADETAVSVLRTSVTDGEADIALNSHFAVLFDAALDETELTGIYVQDSSGDKIATSVHLDEWRTRIELQPEVLLEANSTYQLVVSGVRDLGGNALTEELMITVTTGSVEDTEIGVVEHWSIPTNNAKLMPLNSVLSLTFSEAVDPSSVRYHNFYLLDYTSSVVVETEIAFASDNKTLTLTVNELLEPENIYYIYVGGGANVTDVAGNVLANNTYRYFTTGTEVLEGSPIITGSNIIDGLLTLPTNSVFEFSFSQPLSDTCLLEQSATLSSGETDIPVTITLSSDRTMLSIQSDEDLAASTQYRLELAQICDYSGEVLTPISFDLSTSSATSADIQRPTLVNITPLHQAIDVSTNSLIVLEFDEDVSHLSTPKFYLDVAGTNNEVPGELSFNGNIITFTPDAPFIGSQRYRVEIYSYVKDFAGNSSSSGLKYFNTISETDDIAPQVISVSPENGAVDVVSGNLDIVLTFSEPMSLGTLNNTHIVLYSEGELISPYITRSADGLSVNLSASLPSSQMVSVVLSGQITDISGNVLPHYISSFMTATDVKTDRPNLVLQSPRNGEVDVPQRSDIYYYFDSELDPSSIEDGVIVTENGEPIEVTLSLEGDGRTIKANYSAGFKYNADIRSYLSDSILDTSGNRLYSFDTYFYIEAGENDEDIIPYVTAYSPDYSSINVPLNTVLLTRFNIAMAPSSFTVDNVVLMEVNDEFSSNWTVQPYNISFSDNNRLVTIVPDVELNPSSLYYLSFNESVKAANGQPLLYDYAVYVGTDENATLDTRQPMPLSLHPATGSTGIGVNARFTVTYDEEVSPISFNHDDITNILFNDDNTQVSYHYYTPLAPLAEHTEIIDYAYDLAGNMALVTSTSFTTGNGPDLTRPTITDSSIPSGSDISRNPIFAFTFDEPLDPLSITESNIYLYDAETGEIVPSTIELAASGTRLSLTPLEPLRVLRRYYVYLQDLYDLSHNELSGYSGYFDTTKEVNETAFEVLATTIEDGEVGVPTNLKFNVRFNKPVAPSSGQHISLKDAQGNDVEFKATLYRDRTLLTIVPLQLLAENTEYEVIVDNMSDVNGNLAAQTLTVGFTTGTQTDISTGQLVGWSMPVNAIQNVPLNPLLSVTFDEAIDPATIDDQSFYLYDNKSGNRVEGDWLVSDGGTKLVFDPIEALRPNTRHYLYTGYSPYLTDWAGNRIAQNSYRYFDTATNEDDQVPSISYANIDAGSSSVPINGVISITFDEPLSNHCNATDGIRVEGPQGVHEVNVTLNSDYTSVNIESNSNFGADTTYTIHFDSLCDYAGNTLTGTQWTFSTLDDLEIDNVSPSLVSISPAHQATDVTPNLNAVVMVFDEPINKRARPTLTGGGITIPGSYLIEGDTLTFTPEISLLGETSYAINMYYLIDDLAGNSKNLSTRTFVTAALLDDDAPTVISMSPSHQSTVVDPASAINISFSEPMTSGPINNENISVFFEGIPLSTNLYRSLDGRLITIESNLPENAFINVVVNDQLTDLAGNALAPFISEFETGVNLADTNRPAVVQQIPKTSNVPLFDIDTIQFYLSKAIDPASLADSITLVSDGELIDVDVELLNNDTTILLHKSDGFDEGDKVDVYFDGIRDLSGNWMYPYQGYIQMGVNSELDGVRPYLTTVFPAYGDIEVRLNPTIMIKFSEPMDFATFTDELVIFENITDTANIQTLTKTMSIDPKGEVITILPDEVLLPSQSYRIRLLSGLKDSDGDDLSYSTSQQFFTGEDAVVDDARPNVLAISPPNGATDVGVNTVISTRFDEPINPIQFELTHTNATNIMYSEDNYVVSYGFNQSLSANSQYIIDIDSITDGAGNIVVAAQTVFDTASGPDIVGPTLIDTSLVNNQQDVPVNVSIKWQFSEPLSPTNISHSGVYFQNTTDGQVDTNWSLSTDGTILTVSPATALTTDTQYYVYASGLKDISGNAFGGLYRYFTTSELTDNTPPTIISSSITSGQTDIPLNARVAIRFDEKVNVFAAQTITLQDSSGEDVPFNYTVTRDRSLLTVLPKRLFDANASYTLLIDNTEDISGNKLQDGLTLSFTTGNVVDVERTAISTWSIPVNNTQNVPLNPLLQVTVSERLDPTSIDEDSFYLYDNASKTIVPSTWQLSADGQVLTLSPESALSANTQHYFYFSSSPYIVDLAGNYIGQSNYRYFTTSDQLDATAPSIKATNFSDGYSAVPINGQVVLELTESLSDACDISEAVTLSDSSGVIAVDVSLSSDRQTLTITGQSNWRQNTVFDLSIDALCDYAGNQYADAALLQFTTVDVDTADTVGPALVTTSPVNSEIDVPLNSSIVIEYDEDIDIRSAPPVKQGSDIIDGSYSVEGTTLTFTPSMPFAASTTYTVNLQYNAIDMVGNVKYAGNLSFTTTSSGE